MIHNIWHKKSAVCGELFQVFTCFSESKHEAGFEDVDLSTATNLAAWEYTWKKTLQCTTWPVLGSIVYDLVILVNLANLVSVWWISRIWWFYLIFREFAKVLYGFSLLTMIFESLYLFMVKNQHPTKMKCKTKEDTKQIQIKMKQEHM